ncbi:copper resistance protein CopC [Nocardioides sp. AE5]|uniref:copper resistance CopC family protein n=1 Tax=Nocardioides sp. AE5 TaxID=2962573 RepID=UPI00288134FD|nr:copper resistance protein CopC [Nocardioides sp. AE5]MDT0201637.1 copper resistance protein CopC [Nocardioides sp. AE5]
MAAVLVATLSACLVLVGAGAAQAHAQLVSSDPANGAVVEVAPETITLEFNERIEARGAGTRIFTGDGTEVPATVTTADRNAVVTPGAPLPEGTVVVTWSVVSADGHTISGSVTFAIGAPTPGASGNDVFTEPTTTGIGAARTALVAVVGMAALGLLVAVSRDWPRLREWCWGIGMVAVVGALLLDTMHRDRTGWQGITSWESWVDGWVSWRGLVVAVGVIAAAWLVTAARASRRVPALVAAAVLVMTAPAALALPGPPPGASAGEPGGSPVGEVAAGDHTVRVEFDSMAVGTTGLTLTVLDASGEPAAPYDVPRLVLHTATGADDDADEGAGLDLGAVELVEESSGTYTGQVTIPEPGEWTVEVSLRLDEFTNPVVELPFRFGTRAVQVPSGGH